MNNPYDNVVSNASQPGYNPTANTYAESQKTVYPVPVEQSYQYDATQQSPYTTGFGEAFDGSKILGIISVVFSSVGISCCGIQFGIIGIILGIISLVTAKNVQQKSTTGLVGIILGAVSVLIYIIFIILYFSLIATSMSSLISRL